MTTVLLRLFLFSARHIRFLPLSITWFKPDRGEAINIIGQVFEVSAVCVPNTDTCTFKYYIKTLKKYFDLYLYEITSDLISTWSNCNGWKHVQHSFLNDLEAKGHFIRGADRERIKPVNKLYLHTVVAYCRLNEVQDLDETAYILFNSKHSW